jgi:hypothetical protein
MKEWPILYNLWERACSSHIEKQPSSTITTTWEEEVQVLYKLGISMEETIRFLYQTKPSEEAFKKWVYTSSNYQVSDTIMSHPKEEEDVLTQEDLHFWKENGYVILRNVISKEQCIATQQAIWDFLDMKAEDPLSWYKDHEEKRGLMVLFSNHPTLNANRTSVRIKKAYEQLYQSTDIYKTVDKVSFNPPETDTFHFLGSDLHWDVSLTLPIPFSLQGMLYLTDCDAQDGAFHCVPGFHHQINDWLQNLPNHVNPREEALRTLNPIPVTGKAGDFIIWHQALPHCASPNYGTMPRMVQYLTYLPNNKKTQKEWK